MKRLLIAIVLFATLWGGYWWVGSQGVSRGFDAWLDARRAEGWVAETSDLTVRGFPNRFDTTFTQLRLADPETGWAWEAPFFQLLALSYKPNHVIAVWPNAQTLATPYETLTVTSTKMQASAVVGASAALPLERSTLVADTLSIAGPDDQATTMTALRVAVQRVEGTEATYHLGFAADDLAPARAMRLKLDTDGSLPRTLGAFSADLEASFDRPWDRSAIEQSRPQPTAIKIKLAEARWGELELAAAGQITVDPQGRPDGRIVIKARNWRDILRLAANSGALPQTFANQIEAGLSVLSGLSGNPNTLDIPLDFRAGRMSLGPIPLGPAPLIRLR